MKRALAAEAGMVLLVALTNLDVFGESPQLPPNHPQAQHDESKVPDRKQSLNFADRHFGFIRNPVNGSGAFATGQYRNLFVEAGHTQEEVTHKISAAFQQLFHGDPTNQAVYYEAGANSNGPLAYVTDIKHHDVRTEGLSYGMMIAVQMNRKAEFDAIWNWSKTYLYHDSPAHPSYGFFSWQARTNGTVTSEFVAPDGESYYVMALYFAANRWGSGKGIYNYQAEADRLLTNLRHRAPIKGQIFSSRRGDQQYYYCDRRAAVRCRT